MVSLGNPSEVTHFTIEIENGIGSKRGDPLPPASIGVVFGGERMGRMWGEKRGKGGNILSA